MAARPPGLVEMAKAETAKAESTPNNCLRPYDCVEECRSALSSSCCPRKPPTFDSRSVAAAQAAKGDRRLEALDDFKSSGTKCVRGRISVVRGWPGRRSDQVG